jgi:hypothetical protein
MNLSFAWDYVGTIAAALQQSPVYVEPSTEGTDNDTTAKLKARLASNDNIVLVMLPASAEARSGGDISAIANQLSDELGNQKIIGLSVGKKVVGLGPTLPSGVAADQMRRASSVSNDSVTALNTFVQNVHLYQSQHPQPQPAPPQPAKDSGGAPWPAGVLLVVAGAGILLGWKRRREVQASKAERTQFRVPDKVKDLLSKTAQMRMQVSDKQLQEAVYNLCLDLERYFQSSSRNKEGDSLIFRDRLTEVNQVMAKYIDVQDHSRYYNKPDALLQQGKEAVLDFEDYVLDSIRKGNDAELTEYRVSSDILQAHRPLNLDEGSQFDRELEERSTPKE